MRVPADEVQVTLLPGSDLSNHWREVQCLPSGVASQGSACVPPRRTSRSDILADLLQARIHSQQRELPKTSEGSVAPGHGDSTGASVLGRGGHRRGQGGAHGDRGFSPGASRCSEGRRVLSVRDWRARLLLALTSTPHCSQLLTRHCRPPGAAQRHSNPSVNVEVVSPPGRCGAVPTVKTSVPGFTVSSLCLGDYAGTGSLTMGTRWSLVLSCTPRSLLRP